MRGRRRQFNNRSPRGQNVDVESISTSNQYNYIYIYYYIIPVYCNSSSIRFNKPTVSSHSSKRVPTLTRVRVACAAYVVGLPAR